MRQPPLSLFDLGAFCNRELPRQHVRGLLHPPHVFPGLTVIEKLMTAGIFPARVKRGGQPSLNRCALERETFQKKIDSPKSVPYIKVLEQGFQNVLISH